MLLTERTGPGGSSAVKLIWRLRTFLVFVAATLGLTFGQAYAANCSITTVPTPANITVGQSVDFSGSVSGKPPITYAWTFAGGDPATSAAQDVTVTYNSTGSFEARLNGTNSGNKNQTCTASVTVNVAPVGNQPPVLDLIGDKTVEEGQTLNFQVTASDPNSPPQILTLTATNVPGGATFTDNGDGTGTFDWPNAGPAGPYNVTFTVSDNFNPPASDNETITITVTPVGGGNPPIAENDSYPIDTAVFDAEGANNQPGDAEVPAPGVLLNDTDPDGDRITAFPAAGATAQGGSYDLLADGSFTYTPPTPTFTGEDSFTYTASDGTNDSNIATATLNVATGLVVNPLQNQFAIMMNYELGMHCTGFEFAYCCVLPPYNSILAQVVRTDKGTNDQDFPVLLEADPNIGKDAVLKRETVVRDPALDSNDNFKKYVMRYWHEAQPRNDGRGKPQTSTLISAVERNSLLMWNTVYDKTTDASGPLDTYVYDNATKVPVGDGTPDVGGYANGWLNHLYMYKTDPDGNNCVSGDLTDPDCHLNLEGKGATGQEADKIRLGVDVPIATDCGPSLQPMGPVTTDPADPNNTVPNNCSGVANGNLLTFSTDSGTVVYTQAKVLEDLPITLTSPRIWEALGLPLTPFEDSIDFFGDPGLVDEDSIRPYVAMKAALHEYDPTDTTLDDGDAIGVGNPVLDNGQPVVGFGTAPIDIPNCERCHSVEDPTVATSPNAANLNSPLAEANTVLEKSFWDAYYGIDTVAGDSDWYSRLKAAALSMLTLHDEQNLTGFTTGGDNVVGIAYPACGGTTGTDCGPLPQNTRLGHESVICQKCHADNVIAVVKSANGANGLIPPVTEAIHYNHRSVSEDGPIVFNDGLGRDGGCQGCHPAHRSDGNMAGYPIDRRGNNFYRASNPELTVAPDNRLANGGCFVGRDVHSNPNKDNDGAETPEHLNAVGQYLADNVFRNQSAIANDGGRDVRGIWCTNCHTQLSQEIWKAEDCNDLINGDCVTDIRSQPSLGAMADAINAVLGTTYDDTQLISMLDPKSTNPVDNTHRIWDPEQEDAFAVTAEVDAAGNPQGTTDVDGDFSVNILSFCTTDDCVAKINNNKGNEGAWRYPEEGKVDGMPGFIGPIDGQNPNKAATFRFNVATDGRDHWLSPGEPHCADCHAAPYTEQSGNINAFAPFNYPAKASLMRYSRGHQDITCQGCHESIHGLYPVTPTIDTTTYAQAANLNADGSHGPLKCGSCHEVNSNGIPTWMQGVTYNGRRIRTFDDAVSWAHTFTDEASVLAAGGVCQNCHQDRTDKISETSGKWLRHTFVDRIGRRIQDKAEMEALKQCRPGSPINALQSCTTDADCGGLAGACIGHVAGDPDPDGIPDSGDERTADEIASTVCTACHSLQGGPSAGFLASVGQCDTSPSSAAAVTWKRHLTEGRIAEKVWTFITDAQVNPEEPGDTCGW